MTTTLSRGDRVHQHVADRVSQLQQLYRANRSSGVADLARLRRGVATAPAADLALFGLALGEGETALHGPSRGLTDETTDEEQAAFAAITLYALHQQSRRDTSMHREGYSFGRTARLLGKHSHSRDAVRARFSALGTASTWDETLHHARGLIQQFRQFSLPLDYGQFARDLYDLRRSGSGDRVRMSWGRDFYRTHHPVDDSGEGTEPSPESAVSEDH